MTGTGPSRRPEAGRPELLILRHAKSDWSVALDDFERPLTGRGRRACKRIGRWLAERGLVPDRVLSSPAVRARDTTRRTLKAMGRDPGEAVHDARLYEASAPTLRAVLAEPSGHRRLLLVGHNPGLEDLIRFLVGDVETPADGKLLPTATLYRLVLPDDWRALAPGCAELRETVRPRRLAD